MSFARKVSVLYGQTVGGIWETRGRTFFQNLRFLLRRERFLFRFGNVQPQPLALSFQLRQRYVQTVQLSLFVVRASLFRIRVFLSCFLPLLESLQVRFDLRPFRRQRTLFTLGRLKLRLQPAQRLLRRVQLDPHAFAMSFLALWLGRV